MKRISRKLHIERVGNKILFMKISHALLLPLVIAFNIPL